MEKKLKKIMFNDKYGLTKAVLENRKTQTRRAIKLKDGEYIKVVELDNGSFMSYIAKDGKPTSHVGALEMPNYVRPLTPKYFIGEEVAIAQRYRELEYGVDWVKRSINKEYAGWNNKMFVSAEEMPHRIKIKNIRIEHLQDISEEDVLNEGLEWTHGFYYVDYNRETGFRISLGNDYRNAFATLINNVSGKGTWQSNPYVFVYEFELIR